MANNGGNVSDEQPQQSPLTRPAFLIAGTLVLVVAVLGVIVAVRVGRTGSDVPPLVSISPTGTATVQQTPVDPALSVCGLRADDAPLTSAPAANWRYEGTTSYPQSPELGPGKTAPERYRYCFQHSQAGAAVMAANALVQGSDPDLGDDWSKYALGHGRYRDQLIHKMGTVTGAANTRLKIAGFRLLNYDGATARVDLAVRVSAQNQNLTVSGVYELTWQDGDWKINADVERPLDTATIPDLTGYIPWGE